MVLEHLHAVVVRVGEIEAIVAVDEQSSREEELPEPGAVAEVVEKPPLAIEHLHQAPFSLNQVDVTFRIDGDALGAINAAGWIAAGAEHALEVALGVEQLHAEVHSID